MRFRYVRHEKGKIRCHMSITSTIKEPRRFLWHDRQSRIEMNTRTGRTMIQKGFNIMHTTDMLE